MPKHLIWPGWLLFLALFALAVLRYPSVVQLAGLRLDALFWLLAPFIAFVGANVAHFAARYMDGEAEAQRFWWRLAALLLTALLLVAADHVLWFTAAWTAMAWWLADLIGYRRNQPAARAAGRMARRWLLAGSLAMGVGLLWLSVAAGTASLVEIGQHASAQAPPLAPLLLVILAAVIQCALPPASRWLMSSMTAPTPVSALMHAGMVNAGGILVLRLAPPLAEVPGLLHAVFVVGGLSALLGSLFALVQSDIKRTLAASTVAQMGFMIAQCGLGLFGAAVAHLMLHGLYKARLFLGAGNAVLATAPTPRARPAPWLWAVILPSALLAAAVFAQVSGKRWDDTGAILVLFAAVCAVRAAFAVATAQQLSAGTRSLAIPLLLLPGAAVYGAIVAATDHLLAPLGLADFAQPLHAAHGVVVLAFAAVALWDLSGRLRSSARVYAWVRAASAPSFATISPHRSLHDA
ncbi:proton-conducting transporter membrane subunit [Algiphilus sp.]|uniref:proton-conducting transporter transmembrane domain-containing protein n=1 Tax=Algiphilus sp. TaxID=1872431 RepID=UPI003B51CAB8